MRIKGRALRGVTIAFAMVVAMAVPAFADITSPAQNQLVAKGQTLTLAATGSGSTVQWAVRVAASATDLTCSNSASTPTIAGNVDGFTDAASYTSNGDGTYSFSYSLDTSAMNYGYYCFVFNPSGPDRFVQDFQIVYVGAKDACKDGGWQFYTLENSAYVFDNQGECVSHFQANANADK